MKQANDCDIQNIIDEYTDNELMFTIYDVTKRLCNDGFKVDHHEVKNYFREQDNLSSYYESTHYADLDAMVYHPRVAFGESVNLDSYDPNAVPEPQKINCCSDLTPVVLDIEDPIKKGSIKYKIEGIKKSILKLFSK